MNRNETVNRVQEAANAVAEKVREARLDERASELAALAMEKLREAELEAKASDLAKSTRKMIRDAELDLKAAEIAAATRTKIRESGLDDFASDVVTRVRDAAVALQASDAAQQAAEAARHATDRTLERVGELLGDTQLGEKLSDTAVGERMGLTSESGGSRRSWWAVGLIAGAAAAGAAIAVLRGRSEPEDLWAGEELDASVPTGTIPEATGAARPEASPSDATAPSTPTTADRPLEDRVREALGQDPRTSGMPRLNVNVVEGTVFVRGAVGPTVDQDVLRSVIEGVEGVTDVDLQVTVTT